MPSPSYVSSYMQPRVDPAFLEGLRYPGHQQVSISTFFLRILDFDPNNRSSSLTCLHNMTPARMNMSKRRQPRKTMGAKTKGRIEQRCRIIPFSSFVLRLPNSSQMTVSHRSKKRKPIRILTLIPLRLRILLLNLKLSLVIGDRDQLLSE